MKTITNAAAVLLTLSTLNVRAEEGYAKPVPRQPTGIEHTYDEDRDPVCLLNDVDTAVVEREEDRAASFEKGRSYPPEQLAEALHRIKVTRSFFDAHECGFLAKDRFDAAERLVGDRLAESLSTDAPLFLKALPRLQGPLRDLERAADIGEMVGWPGGSKASTAVGYAGLFDGPEMERVRTYLVLASDPRTAPTLRESVQGKPVEPLARLVFEFAARTEKLERKLGLPAGTRPGPRVRPDMSSIDAAELRRRIEGTPGFDGSR